MIYHEKLSIVEYEGSIYTNIASNVWGDTAIPSIEKYWIPISFWQPGNSYKEKDVVVSDNVKYICYLSNTGASLQDTNYWRRFYLWPYTSAGGEYKLGEIVVTTFWDDPELYECIDQHIPDLNNRPGDDDVNWQPFWKTWNP